MTLEALSPGAVFAGRYRVVRAVARGGMGAVFEVVHLETQRRRALKVILPGVLESEEMRRRFQLEAQVAARIESEFVVDVFDAGVDEASDMPFLVMELLRGEELGARLKRVGRLAPAEVVVVLHQTALALDRMRAANVVHRDLKPENLFLTEREEGPARIKVLDLGIAKILAEGSSLSQGTRSLGTPLYMAPEQLGSECHVTPATDIYALGMIAYTLLVGRAYFVEEAYELANVLAFALAVRRGPPESPVVRAARGGVTLPPAFAAWFGRATALDPRQRFVTAVSAVADLAAALGVAAPTTGSSILAAPPSSAALPPVSAVALPPISAVALPPVSAASSPLAPASLPPSAAPRPPTATATSLGLTGGPALRSGAPMLLAVAAVLVLGGAASLVVLGQRAAVPPPAPSWSSAASAAHPPEPPEPAPSRPVDVESTAAVADGGGGRAVDAGLPAQAPPRAAPPRTQAPIYSRD